jgi:hypothetical protein
MADKSVTHSRGLKSPHSILIDDFRGEEFHPWKGTQDDLVTLEREEDEKC